jgi:hypothetical protein
MRSIERRFNAIQVKHPEWSSFICFVEAVRGQGFKRESIRHWFCKSVDPDDFSKSDKRDLLDFLERLNTPPGEGVLGVYLPPDARNNA